MEILHDAARPARKLRRPSLAIGAFDGVHRGHRRLFEVALAGAARDRGEAAVLTFDPHPATVLSPEFAPPLVTSTRRKLELCEEAGVAVAVVQPFDRAFAATSADEFVDRLLVRGLGAARVVVGYDFTYGHRRAGTVASLVEAGRANGFAVDVVPPFAVEGIVCSSTRVRQFVLEGRLAGAALLLGRPCEIVGAVVAGRGRGRLLGIPTANLAPEADLLPPVGVYAAWASAGDAPPFGRARAVVNVGRAPTFEAAGEITVEAHLLDFANDLYGRRLVLAMAERLRGEERFPSPEALRRQIDADIARAREILS